MVSRRSGCTFALPLVASSTGPACWFSPWLVMDLRRHDPLRQQRARMVRIDAIAARLIDDQLEQRNSELVDNH
jgi:hypothetical protein